MRIRFTLRTLFVLISLIAFVLSLLYWIPKPKTMVETTGYREVGYYRGLGMTNNRGYFGKNWYRFVAVSSVKDCECRWEVEVSAFGYAPYYGYYGSGALREKGVCVVRKEEGCIVADYAVPLNAEYYAPNGKLISEVANGTGRQMYCYNNGRPMSELDLENGNRVRFRDWHPNGQLAHDAHYRDGKMHGTYVSYYENGAIRVRGDYSNGVRVGSWKYYTASGGLDSEFISDDEDSKEAAE